MKKLLLFLLISVGLNAQFNYQAIVKDSDGNPVTNNQVKFKFSLIYQSATASPVFVEEHELVTPPDGVVNLSVGEGTVVNGTFSDVDWSQSVFMKEELDTGSGYQDMGTRQIASVPVAEYAKKISGLNTKSSTISLDDTITSFITTGVVSATGFKGNADEITITDSGTLSKLIDIIKDLRNEISSLKKNDQCLIISPGSISEIKDSFCVGETPPIISETSSPVTDGESNISFFWEWSIDNFASQGNIISSNSANLQLPNLKQSIQVRRVVVSDYNSISCSKTSNIISINVVQSSEPPSFILRDINASSNRIFTYNNIKYNNTICQDRVDVNGGVPTPATDFYVCYDDDSNSIDNTYLWMLTPPNAGVIDTDYNETGKISVQWDQLFSGNAVLEVVASGCGNSTPKQVNLTIIPETIIPLIPNEITEPYFLSDTGHAIEEVFCNGEIMGPLPECEVTESTPNTQFFSHSVGETNDYASLEWRISNPIPGDPSLPSPGVINASTGVVNWTTGWWGTFDIEVRPVSCSGTVPDNWIGTTFTIGPSEDDRPNIFPLTDLPDCPIPPGGLQTTLRVPDFPVRWFINDLNSIEIGTGFNNLIDESTKELKSDIGTNDQELTLFWRPGYSGFTTIKAIPRDCPGSEGSYTIVVPEQQKISHIINDDTNGELNQTIRLGESIDEIKFELLGAATGVMSEVSMNLPPGINMTIENFNQESEITLSSVFTPSVGQKYSLSIDGFDYDYRVQVGDDIDDIGIGLSNIIPGSEMMTSFNTATNILSLVGSIPGKYYAIKPNLPSNNAVSFSSVRSNENLRMITLSGTPNSLALIGETTDYNYTIETSGGANYCSDNDSISGLIRIIYYDPCSELNPGSITSSQTICSGDIPNQLNINQASVGENSSNVIYEWFSSIDNETFNTTGITTPDFQSQALTKTTYFKRIASIELNNNTCVKESNISVVQVGPEGKLLMNGESHQSISICSDDSPIFSIDGSQEGDSYTFRIDEGFLTNSDNPTFDPVSLGFVFAPGVTYSVDAIIYDQPLNPANDTPDPSACYGYTSSILILSDPQVCP